MKNLTFILLAALTIFGCSPKQSKYTVVIRLNDIDLVDKMYLFKDIGEAMDSAVHDNGEYRFSGLFTEPQLCLVSHENNPISGKLFILDKGETIITGDLKNFSEADITFEHKVNNELFRNFQNQFSEYENCLFNQITPELEKAEENNDTIKMEIYKDKLDSLAKNQRTKIFRFTEDNSNSAGTAISISVVLLPRKYLKTDEFVKIYDMYSESNKKSFYGLKLKDHIEPPMKVGEQVINFTMENSEGKEVSIHDYRDKYVLIDFWASWCAPCRDENPNLIKAYDLYNSKGFEIIGISLDTDKEAWLKAIEKDKLNWTNLSDLKGWQNELAQHYKVKGVPTNMLIDKNGKIIAIGLRGPDLLNKLEEIFNK